MEHRPAPDHPLATTRRRLPMKRTHCAVDDCPRPRSGGSVYCATHRGRFYRTGTTDPGPRVRMPATQCAAPQCDHPAPGRSPFCPMHARRMAVHGNLIGKRPQGHGFGRHAPAPERFFAKVDRSGVCWVWTAGGNENGYGHFSPGHGLRREYAHRWSYEHHVGPIPPGMVVMHACDNPPCVNPAHLSLGTNQDNMLDMVAKGRSKTKTCRAGHAWEPETTSIRVDPKGQTVRRCLICIRERSG